MAGCFPEKLRWYLSEQVCGEVMCKSALSSPMDWILRYIETYLYFFFYKGTEFLNRPFQKLLETHGIHHFVTHNEETKASIVERFNRTLKTRMWRYFTKHQTLRYVEALPGFMRSYNKTYHRTIGMAPTSVDASNQETVWQRIYGGHRKKTR